MEQEKHNEQEKEELSLVEELNSPAVHVESCEDIHVETRVESQFASMSLPELIEAMGQYNSKEVVESRRAEIEEIRAIFYKKYKVEIDEQRNLFVQNGGDAKDFVYDLPYEQQLKEIYNSIKAHRATIAAEHEAEKSKNLQKRYAIIEAIKELVTKEESLGKTFKEFHDLQEQWRAIGTVPQTDIKQVWEQYHHFVRVFYDYVKINKELRDLDLRKNFEAKIHLCERAEALLLEPQIVKAFSKLQELHDLWRETGPVPEEKSEDLWVRFKTATTLVNKKHQDYFLQVKEQEKVNLDAKNALCEKIEEIVTANKETIKDWNTYTEEVLNIQKVWKTIGFAPQKFNNQVYERFCIACNHFYSQKRAFYETIKTVEEENKLKKIQLCEVAEEMKLRLDWKEATQDFLELQKAWKEIGHVSHKDSVKLWKRFRLACDEFFEAKKQFYEHKDHEQIHNLELKKALIQKIEALQIGDDVQQTLQELQGFQKEWAEIGFIPAKKKDAIQKQYRDAVQVKYDAIQMPKEQKQKAMFKVRVQSLMHESQGSDKVHAEAIKLQNRIKAIENDIHLLGNNIGFFAKSKNAEKLILEVEAKITKGKNEIAEIKEQLRLIQKVKEDK